MAIKYAKRHYEDMASILKGAKGMVRGEVGVECEPAAYRVLEYVENNMLNMFTIDNPRFDADRFRKAAK